jgi:hypothetical protein
MLREIGDLTGLTSQVSDVLADAYKGQWVHDPGRVFTDLAAAVADGADCVSFSGGRPWGRVSVPGVCAVQRLMDRV